MPGFFDSTPAPGKSRRWRGWMAVGVALQLIGLVSAQTPGSLDTSPFPGFAFGNGKIANLAIGSGSGHSYAVAVQPDGKIVLAGDCQNGLRTEFCIARLNPDGGFDQSFDGPGGTGDGRFLLPIGTVSDRLSALAIQLDGKLVLAGSCSLNLNDNLCVARLNPDGSLDESFDGPTGSGNGRFILEPRIAANRDRLTAVAVQPDGKILLTGYCLATSSDKFCVARLNPDGTWDTSFVGPGGPDNGPGNGRFLLPIGSGYGEAYALAIQPDGKIVLAGACRGVSDGDFCVARLNPNGTLDTSFVGPGGASNGPGDGRVLLPIGTARDFGRALAIQPDGKLIIGGSCEVSPDTFDFCVARLSPNGSFDATFGLGGVTRAAIGTSHTLGALALQPDGNIVIAGSCSTSGGVDFCIARIDAHGFFDPSFDGPSGASNGGFLLPIGADDDFANALAIQPDGKLVVAGGCNSSSRYFCVARLNGGPFSARNCSRDLDGDGLMTATIDALINTRVQLGVRGPAVLNGINFPANAKRNTWPAIRDYLVSQCGMNVY